MSYEPKETWRRPPSTTTAVLARQSTASGASSHTNRPAGPFRSVPPVSRASGPPVSATGSAIVVHLLRCCGLGRRGVPPGLRSRAGRRPLRTGACRPDGRDGHAVRLGFGGVTRRPGDPGPGPPHRCRPRGRRDVRRQRTLPRRVGGRPGGPHRRRRWGRRDRLEARGSDRWSFRLRFPDHAALSAFHATVRERGIRLHVERTYTPSGPPDDRTRVDLSAAQREALCLALRRGYFETPSAVTLDELAEELGITRQALSTRIRLGNEAVLRQVLPDAG